MSHHATLFENENWMWTKESHTKIHKNPEKRSQPQAQIPPPSAEIICDIVCCVICPPPLQIIER